MEFSENLSEATATLFSEGSADESEGLLIGSHFYKGLFLYESTIAK